MKPRKSFCAAIAKLLYSTHDLAASFPTRLPVGGRRQFLMVTHSTSLRLRYLQAASALSLSSPAKRARYRVVPPLSKVSVNASAPVSTLDALLCTAERRC